MNFDTVGLQVPRILLPKAGTDMQCWAVIACDQYTSDRHYWQRLEQQTAHCISTLKLIFPEVYLDDDNSDQRIAAINATMNDYLANGSLVEQPAGFILIDRKTCAVPSRKGLMVALDLEKYDYSSSAHSLIRATEGTILDRLPPRIKVRQNAAIELPHIMVLIDDPQQTVIEPLFEHDLEKLYDFELLENGGHLTGYRVADPALIRQVVTALEQLADPVAYRRKYGVDSAVMLYAMGDGNHSFATAKAIWEQIKAEAGDPASVADHPARYALVELVNLHDPGLEFEAIHRVLFNSDPADLPAAMERFFAARHCPFTFQRYPSLAAAQSDCQARSSGHAFAVILGGAFGVCHIENPQHTLCVATVQNFLDHYTASQPQLRVDYIHGTASVTELGSQSTNCGFYLPAISKHELFKTIILDGALPRKTFSMGEADEKRFYLECRAISAPTP